MHRKGSVSKTRVIFVQTISVHLIWRVWKGQQTEPWSRMLLKHPPHHFMLLPSDVEDHRSSISSRFKQGTSFLIALFYQPWWGNVVNPLVSISIVCDIVYPRMIFAILDSGNLESLTEWTVKAVVFLITSSIKVLLILSFKCVQGFEELISQLL